MALNSNIIIKESKSFSEEKVSKVLWRFAIPAIISLFVAELYNMVDTIFVGRAIGATAVGALTIAFPIQRLIISIGLLIAVGASTAVSRSLGEGSLRNIKHVVMNALTLMLIGVFSLMVFVYRFKDSIIKHLGATDNIFPFANEYISIVIWGSLFQCFTVIVGYIMTSLGNTKANLIANSIGAISNIVLDYILVIGFSQGVKGAAIATVISQIIASGYALYHFLKIKRKFDITFTLSLNKEFSLAIIAVGFSTFIVEISDAIVATILNNILSSKGDLAIIIVGVISKVSMFLYITVIGITSAMQPIAAYNYGAKNFIRLKEVVRESIKALTLAAILLWLFMMVFASPIISTFIKEKHILVEAVKAFRIVISIFPTVGIYYIAIYYYQSIEEAKVSFALSIYRQLLIFIPIVFVSVKTFGLIGAWIAYPISDIISAFTGLYYMKKAKEALEDRYEEYEGIANKKKVYDKALNNIREA